MIFDEIESALNIWEKFRNWRNSRKGSEETVAARFVRLFESHGVHRNQIPRFYDHGLTLKDVQGDDALLLKLDEITLDDVCKLFAIQRAWLDGADSTIYPYNDFYKHPEAFSVFINGLKASNPDGNLSGVLFAPEDAGYDAEAILVLYETIGSVVGNPIYRYHLCNNWSFSYWKARGYLTACIALAWRSGVHIRGNLASKKSIKKLAHGEVLLGDPLIGIDSIHGKLWYPEDMTLKPEVYLKDIDPELDNFGIKSGLELWLKLEESGLMNTSLKKNARELFSQKLGEYKSA